jgi:hypothetical protein
MPSTKARSLARARPGMIAYQNAANRPAISPAASVAATRVALVQKPTAFSLLVDGLARSAVTVIPRRPRRSR